MSNLIGREYDKVLRANLGNGYATYVEVEKTWYSVNTYHGTIADIRWIAKPEEIKKIEENKASILDMRVNPFDYAFNLYR